MILLKQLNASACFVEFWCVLVCLVETSKFWDSIYVSCWSPRKHKLFNLLKYLTQSQLRMNGGALRDTLDLGVEGNQCGTEPTRATSNLHVKM